MASVAARNVRALSAPLPSRVGISGRRDACAGFIDDQLVGSFYRVGATERSSRRGKGNEGSWRARKGRSRIEPSSHSHPVYLSPPRRRRGQGRRRQRAFSAARLPVGTLGVIGVVAVAIAPRHLSTRPCGAAVRRPVDRDTGEGATFYTFGSMSRSPVLYHNAIRWRYRRHASSCSSTTSSSSGRRGRASISLALAAGRARRQDLRTSPLFASGA